MPGEAYWVDLRPMLQELSDRIARIEQVLAASGQLAPGSSAFPASASASGAGFDAVPASFGAPPGFNAPPAFDAPPAFGGPSVGLQPGFVPDDLVMLARSGKKIQAIAELRKRAGISLKEAKDLIDQAASGY